MTRLLLPLLLVLSACATAPEKKTPDLMSQRLAERTGRPDMSKRSSFDKAMQSSITHGKQTGGWLGRQKYSAKKYTQTPAYSTPSFPTTPFSGSQTQSPLASQKFAQADKTPAEADDTFKTTTSPLARQTARESTQTFSPENDLFKTGPNRDALKSQKKNTRPEIIRLSEQEQKPAYTEDQVRALLGRK